MQPYQVGVILFTMPPVQNYSVQQIWWWYGKQLFCAAAAPPTTTVRRYRPPPPANHLPQSAAVDRPLAKWPGRATSVLTLCSLKLASIGLPHTIQWNTLQLIVISFALPKNSSLTSLPPILMGTYIPNMWIFFLRTVGRLDYQRRVMVISHPSNHLPGLQPHRGVVCDIRRVNTR